ncbi:MAG: hypothetical protein JXB24_07405 [Bacteroidales bacterium]|nr:hypothetical protein [Bacteroidales bacterium]
MDNKLQDLLMIYMHFKNCVFEFDAIFQDDKEHQDILKMLPNFFADLKNLYFERFYMLIARLLDGYGKKNLTLYMLPAILKANGKDENQVRAKIDNLKIAFKNELHYRNKYLAHLDLDYITGKKTFGTTTEMKQIEYFLQEMLNIINETLCKLGQPEESGILLTPWNSISAKGLIEILKKENLRRKSSAS